VKIDLHLHSCYSGDGIHNIGFLTQLFSSGDIVALTDHETIAGWDEFKVECEQRGLKPIFGIEWFADDCHILSYFPNPNIPKEFKEFISERRRREKKTMRFVAESYNRELSSFPQYDSLLNMKNHPEDTLGMLVLGCKIKRIKGLDFKEAIKEIRARKHSFSECPEIFNTEELIAKLSAWGGIIILAHPFRRKDCDDKAINKFYKLIIKYKSSGLNGIELHPKDNELNTKIKEICRRLDLICTVGSDYHCYKAGIYPIYFSEGDVDVLSGLKKVKLI
jgi:3',5'-nucleoside bisphosphate phosphatase